MTSWLGGLFGGNKKSRKIVLSKLTEDDVQELNKKLVKELIEELDVKSWEDMNFSKDCGETSACCGLDN